MANIDLYYRDLRKIVKTLFYLFDGPYFKTAKSDKVLCKDYLLYYALLHTYAFIYLFCFIYQ